MKRFIRQNRIKTVAWLAGRAQDRDRKFEHRRKFLDLLGTVSIPYCAEKGETVVQCGCWRIESVLQWVNTVGPKGTVVIVEADDVNCMVLEIEKKRRRLDNVIIVNKAIFGSKATVTFLYSDFTPTNKIRELATGGTAPSDGQKEKQVQADTLDAILAEAGVDKVDHIHFTISGAEYEALEGMQRILTPGLRIYARSTCLHAEDYQPVRERVVEKMRDKGFRVHVSLPEPARNMGGNLYAMLD